jgi:glycosyltransferase involved in cell wall biosynthesis
LKKIYFTVTNDLSYDRRMNRICSSLANAGYSVVLVGRKLPNSVPLSPKKYQQKRLTCFFNKGKLFYAEYNFRLFFYLLFKKVDAICCIDLDTILPALFISNLKRIKRVYDAHELFCEMKEVVIRPKVYKIWKRIEKFSVPKFSFGYTVSKPIADEFEKMYGVKYELIRNVPFAENAFPPEKKEKYILYQGAVNEGRSFETLIPAMKNVDAKLIICGDGNFMQQAKKLVAENDLADKIVFKGMISPDDLKNYTLNATVGITLFENTGISNYYSLANRFFDYIQAGVPQLCVDYPAYQEINKQYKIALLIEDLSSQTIALSLNNLLQNDVLYKELQNECLKARQVFNWQQAEKKLLSFYENIFQIK